MGPGGGRGASVARWVAERARGGDGGADAAATLRRRTLDAAARFHPKDAHAHYGCVNAIEFSADGRLLASGGDDRRVLVWRVGEMLDEGRPRAPAAMRAEHGSNIFCLTLSEDASQIFSAGNDETVIVHDLQTGGPLHYFLHEKPVYCISLEPGNANVFCSASDDGRVLVFDTRRDSLESTPVVLAESSGAFHGVHFNPAEPRLVATANAKQGLRLYDLRRPKQHVVWYGGEAAGAESCMSVRFNGRGTQLLGLRRRREALVYPTHSAEPGAEFDHPGYYNSCTMKSCCFAGPRDDFVLSGSDDFNLYMWRVPQQLHKGVVVKRASHVLSGHRSIVNQVRYNAAFNVIASSGVEKIIKIWSPLRLPGNCDEGGVARRKRPRKMFTHEEYITLVLQSGQFMSHDYSQQNTDEDPRMMAFFDSLVQREVEGWSSDEDGEKISSDSTASSSDAEHETYFMGFRSRPRPPPRPDATPPHPQNGDAEEEEGDESVDETNNLISKLILKKRRKLQRSRTRPKSTPSTGATPSAPSAAAPEAVAGCSCALGRRRPRPPPPPAPKRPLPPPSTSSSSDGDGGEGRVRSVAVQPGVEGGGGGFRRSQRRPDERNLRRRRPSTSPSTSDSD